jgi:class 3 adenylate cyclase/predicted ATPase
MQQTVSWLERLGLGQYAFCFAENDIEFSMLRDLTDSDLEKLGVPSLGHRRKLVRAIANLRAIEMIAPAVTTALDAPTAPRDCAERRQVTVMFSDIVGSTALSARLDPEDLREVLSAYQKRVAEVVERFDGFVAKYLGDGVLAYFGYPRAHEDDAERAVRAGLEVVAAVGRLEAGASLETRVGIATGMVVVGDLIGSGDAQERGIIGETPNLAARLQGIAAPNAVVIAESTRRLLGNLFELEDLGSRPLRGVRLAQAWVALRPSAVESRFEALRATSLTALVGRDEELELLLRRWSRAKTGEGHAVLVSGEAGIGKSRLATALHERLAAEPHTRLRYFCSPQHTDSALYPLVCQMDRAAGLAPGDTPHERLDKLDALLARSATSREDAALLAELLSLPNDGRHPSLELTPSQRRQRTLEALVSQIRALTCSSPVLILFEDAQWSDPTSLEALGRVMDLIATLPVMVVVTFRPEFDPPWIGQPHSTALTINRLGRCEVSAMIDHIARDSMLSASIREDIIERTDGIPLFVEEMTKAVLEEESVSEAQPSAAALPSRARTVPASLHASLMARLDRLGGAKEVAQIGAAIGREFSYALLASVGRRSEADLGAALDCLVAAGLLFRRGVPPHARYLFKHSLVQDAAYGTMLREPRRALHARIAEAIESQVPEIAESQPELLARHCTEAGLVEKAAGLWSRAGWRSLARSALVEAIEQFTRALAETSTLPATPGVRREQIKLQVALITPLGHVKGFTAPETKAAAERAHVLIEEAEALGERSEDPLLLFSILHSFWVAKTVALDGDVARDLAAQFLALAEKQGATIPLMVGHRLMGASLLCTGVLAEGRAHLDQAVALYDPAEHRPLATRFGQDNQVAVLSFRSVIRWLSGFPDDALADTRDALSDAREIGQAATLMFALTYAAWSRIHCRDYVGARAHLDELVARADETGAIFWKTLGLTVQGWLSALSERAPDAIHMLTSGIAALRSTGATIWMPTYLACLAKAYAERGQFEDAWRSIREAMSTIEATKERWCEAEVYRMAGELALSTQDAAKAEGYFERALAVARQQQAKSWELRAAMSMARLWRDQGRRQEAHDLLVRIYGWFTQGFDTLDVREAGALLDELTPPASSMRKACWPPGVSCLALSPGDPAAWPVPAVE